MKSVFFKGIVNIFGSKNKNLFFRYFSNYFFAFFRIPKNVPFPLEMQIEPSAVCNLRCEMCSLKNSQPKGDIFLKKENASRLLDNLKTLRSINFTGMGEALMNNNLTDIIKMTSQRNIQTLFISNGQLLSPSLVKNIIESELNKIVISLESADQKIYENIRKGAKIRILKKNLLLLKEAIKKTKNKKKKIMVCLNVVLLKENLKITAIKKIIDLAKINGINEVSFQFPHDLVAFNLRELFNNDKKILTNLFKSIKEYAERKKVKISLPSINIKNNSCYYPWIYPQITSGGELLPCCVIPQFGNYQEIINKYSFGNVFENDFSSVWNSQKAIAFRKNLKNNPNPYCRKCSKYFGVL